MTNINLLPWRERRRQEYQRLFLIGAGVSVVAALLIMLMTHLYYVNKIEAQQVRNRTLANEISIVDRKIYSISQIEQERTRLRDKIDVVSQLEHDRSRIVHVFDALYHILPQGAYYTTIVRTGETLDLQGKAESNTDISALMRNVEANTWLTNPVLLQSKALDVAGSEQYVFDIRVNLVNPNAQKGGDHA